MAIMPGEGIETMPSGRRRCDDGLGTLEYPIERGLRLVVRALDGVLHEVDPRLWGKYMSSHKYHN